MFYEVHILGGDVFGCEADNCLDPDNSELVERIFRSDDPDEVGYSVMHQKDWAAADNKDKVAGRVVDAEIEATV